MLGDWNTRIRPDAFDILAGTVEPFLTGETKERGIILLEFANSYKLSI